MENLINEEKLKSGYPHLNGCVLVYTDVLWTLVCFDTVQGFAFEQEEMNFS